MARVPSSRNEERQPISSRKMVLTLIIICFGAQFTFSQQNTNLGTNAGNAGVGNTSVGYNAGDDVTGTDNSFFGRNSAVVLTSGNYNSFFGAYAGNGTIGGSSNTFLGYSAGNSNQSGSNNTLIGRASGYATTGSDNTFVGYYSGRLNTTASGNTAVGKDAMFNNTTGFNNVSLGYGSLYTSSTGRSNVAIGYTTLYSNTANDNTAIGNEAMYANTSGGENVAIGNISMTNNTTGLQNTAIGTAAMVSNTTGYFNTAIGHNSGPNTTNLINSMALGHSTVNTASNQIRLGNATISSIGGFEPWTDFSDSRFKTEIKEDVPGLDFINQLRPVSYFIDKASVNTFLGLPEDVKNNLENIATEPVRKTGFLAQEVEQIVNEGKFVFNGVDAPQNEKDYYGIRYATFVVPLVKAVQELNAKLSDQEKKIEEQQKTIESLQGKEDLSPNSDPTGSINENETMLYQNNPNPFSTDTEIQMKLSDASKQARVMVYNLEGVELKSFPVEGRGNTSVIISGQELKPGMYIYTLVVDGKIVDSKRMILTK